jgi:hypothetical protein
MASKIVHIQDKGLTIHLLAQLYHVVLKVISIYSLILNLKIDEASLGRNCSHCSNILKRKIRLIDSDVSSKLAPTLLLN